MYVYKFQLQVIYIYIHKVKYMKKKTNNDYKKYLITNVLYTKLLYIVKNIQK